MKAGFWQVQDVEYPDLKVQEINANHQNLCYMRPYINKAQL